jgi:hypothetical protein
MDHSQGGRKLRPVPRQLGNIVSCQLSALRHQDPGVDRPAGADSCYFTTIRERR